MQFADAAAEHCGGRGVDASDLRRVVVRLEEEPFVWRRAQRFEAPRRSEGTHAEGEVPAAADGPPRLLTRAAPWLCAAATKATRLPTGHPEAFFEAFANVYGGVGEAIRARVEQRSLAELEGDFPSLAEGARGVRFIEKTVESARSEKKWTAF